MSRAVWLPVVGAFVSFIVIWQLVVVLTDLPPYILPPPGDVAQRFVSAWLDGTVWPHFATTMSEILIGFCLGAGLGLLVGYGLARSALFERLASPYIVAAQAVPILVLAPLLVLWFGPGLLSKVVICSLIVFFPVAIATMVGIRSVDPRLLELGRSLRATQRQILTSLEIPAALPNIFGGLRVGVTLAVVGAVVGEFVGSNSGIGYLLQIANGNFDLPLMFAALTVLSGIGVLLFVAIDLVEKLMIPWHASHRNDFTATA